ncbi:phosphate-starvation-inducible PsiE family protein [Microbulbifer sp. THAF38]|uniref:phosphate-starvation-inducible PsiE family protein n=1 Tax=Microbulbifer sp. THAF38 TaxID=2587856 RepID=UPI0012AA5E40|nr:phosphate-starvation-inducible PsiE family protein [Microbulbifer sp. THAF38]QFT54896.1 Phosphate-starvation-inducible E [Microbulbifer sp. THAF38]
MLSSEQNSKVKDSMISEKIKIYFDKSVDVVFGIILVFIIVGIAAGTLQLFLTTWKLFNFEGITGHYIDIITDVLTLYVLIELSRSLIEYFHTHKLRLTFIVDAAIVFVLREILIALFKHEIKAEMLYAFSAFIFVLGALRICSILVYQREKLMSE